MNRKYDGNMVVHLGVKLKRGKTSKAAKCAFEDILNDPDMRVIIDKFAADGHLIKVPMILTEENCIIFKEI